MMRLLILICVLCIRPVEAQHFRIDSTLRQAYEQIIMLEYDNAGKILSEYGGTNHHALVLLQDFNDFVRLFIQESPDDFNKLKSLGKKRLERIRRSGPDDAISRFIQSEILLHWSLIYLKLGRNAEAFLAVREALGLLETNQKKHPEFMLTYKSLGILHTLIGTIPQEFGWIARLAGFEGSIEKGRAELEKFINYAERENDIFRTEAVVALAFVRSYMENRPQSSLELWNSWKLQQHSSPALKMLGIKLHIRAGDFEAARKTISELGPTDKRKLPYLNYMTGLMRLQNLDPGAVEDFENFLSAFRGRNYVKEALQKAAWAMLLAGDTRGYEQYMQRCLREGASVTDEDLAAEKEARSGEMPDIFLLKARLLFDGGYYERAFHILTRRSTQAIPEESIAEYSYRMGRICHLLKDYNQALGLYKDLMNPQNKGNASYGCSAALFSGMIMEAKGQTREACHFYQKTLDMKSESYARSLHQKAKAAIYRLNCAK